MFIFRYEVIGGMQDVSFFTTNFLIGTDIWLAILTKNTECQFVLLLNLAFTAFCMLYYVTQSLHNWFWSHLLVILFLGWVFMGYSWDLNTGLFRYLNGGNKPYLGLSGIWSTIPIRDKFMSRKVQLHGRGSSWLALSYFPCSYRMSELSRKIRILTITWVHCGFTSIKLYLLKYMLLLWTFVSLFTSD